MRWSKARGTLILLAACFSIATLLLPKPPVVKTSTLPPKALVRLGSTHFRHAGRVTCIAYSPSGDLLASGGEDHFVRLWDAHSGIEIRRFVGHTREVESIAFSPDGALLASGSGYGAIRLWHIASGRLLETIQTGCSQLMFSRDGRTLLVGDSSGTFQGWDLRQQRWVCTSRPNGKVACTTVSPRGDLLALTSDPTMQLWDVMAATRLCDFGERDPPIETAALSADGAMLATGESNGVIRLWDTSSGRRLHRIETHAGQFSKLIFSNDAAKLIGVSNHDSVRVWDVASGRQMHVLGRHFPSVRGLCLSPDGQTVAAAVDSVIHLWDLNSGKQLHPVPERELPVASLRFAQDRRSLILECTDGSVRVWDWTTGHERRCWRNASTGILGSPLPITLSPDGRLLAEAIDGQTIRLRDVETNRDVRTLHTAEYLVTLDFSPDGKLLVSRVGRGTQLWSAHTGAEVEIIRGVQLGMLDLLLFSPDGRWIVVSKPLPGIIDGQPRRDDFYLWDRITPRFHRVIKGQESWLSPHIFSPDGRMLAGTDGGFFEPSHLVLWETATGGERLRLPAFGNSIHAMAFSPDGRTLALGCGDSIIRLWDVATGKVQQILRSDQGPIHALVFSDDGDRLASAGASRNVLIWDVSQRRQRTGEARTLPRKELEASWRELADVNASRTFKAQQTLAGAPHSALEFLRERLRPVIAPESAHVRRLIADLDSDSYPVREQATRQLEQLGDGTEVYLRQVLEQRPSLELRRRVEQLLESLAADSPEHLRVGRALEVLEWLNTPDSRRLLAELAHGAPETWLTREAKATLDRLRKQGRSAS